MTEAISEISAPQPPSAAALDIVIRFKNSEKTLPAVLASLASQTFRDFRILGIDTGSTDSSAELVRQAGGDAFLWDAPYHHSKVLNFGVRHGSSPLVMALSSHTALTNPDTLADMVAVMSDPRAACVSAKWDDDPYYSDRITWDEIREKGLKFGSIYSNSMGMFRRAFWEQEPFDESLSGCEDYAWAVAQLHHGHVCLRMDFPFSYERSRNDRVHELCLATHLLAKKHGLEVAWMGAKGTIKELFRVTFKKMFGGGDREALSAAQSEHREKLRAWLDSRSAAR